MPARAERHGKGGGQVHGPDVQERARVRLVLARPIAAYDTHGEDTDPRGRHYDALVDYAPGTAEHFEWAAARLRPFYRMPEGRSA